MPIISIDGYLSKIIDKLTNNKVAIGSEQISVTSGSATGFTAATMAGATSAFVTVDIASIKYQEYGTPTSTIGNTVASGGYFIINTAQNLSSFLAIAISTTAKINVTYYK